MTTQAALEAIRRLTQALMVLVAVPIVAIRLWCAATFAHDRHPWLLIAVLLIVATLPIVIWWREAAESRAARLSELMMFSIASTTGLLLFMLFAAWVGFLLSDPYNGPMAAEATVFLLVIYSSATALSCLLALSPLLLDARFFPAAVRRRAWRAAAYALPVVGVLALLAGPRLDWLFR